jgi:hypothetical protein
LGKSLGKLGEFLGKLGERIFAGFSGFSCVGVIFGTAVMARWTGRQDHGGAGFPSWWPAAVLGRHAWVMVRVRVVPAGFAARAPRKGIDRGFERGLKELSGKVLKTRVTY